MPRFRILGLLFMLATSPSALRGDESKLWQVRTHASGGSIELQLRGHRFTTYSFQDEKIPRPYFANFVLPSGIQVTRRHPPQAGDAQDHAELHPGLWLAFGDLSAHDSWRLRAPVKHIRFVQPPLANGSSLHFSVENHYLSGDSSQVICQETCHYELRASENQVLLIWDSLFRSDKESFWFGDQEEMGLGVRVATPITVKAGGRILNSDGQRNEREVWGKPAAWCDYSGQVNSKFVGVMLVPDPRNFRDCWYHARDYGFVAANPFGQQAFTRGEKSKIVVKPGESLRLRYGVAFHWNDREADFAPVDIYRDMIAIWNMP